MDDAGRHQRFGKGLCLVAGPVVAHHSLDLDAIRAEEGPGPGPKGDGRGGPLVTVDLLIGQARVRVDGRVDVGVSEPGSTGLAVLARLDFDAPDPPAAALGDLGLLLGVDMDKLAGANGLNPADDPAGSAFEVRESRDPMASPHPMQCRGGNACLRSQPGRSELMTASQFDQAPFHLRGGLGRTAPRPTRTVHQTSSPGFLIAMPPLVSRLS